MAKKRERANGEGSIYQRNDGRWAASITLANHKRKTFYGKTKAQVREKLRVALNEQKEGTLVTGPQQSVKAFLEYWLEEVHKPTIKIGTYTGYRIILDKHIIPAIGYIQLQKLTVQHVQSFYTAKVQENLSAPRIRSIHRVLHKALTYAVRLNYVSRNVCDFVSLPRLVKRDIEPLTLEQAQKLIQAAKGHTLECMIPVALATGMRRGELTALRWKDIDMDKKVLQVRHSVNRYGSSGWVESSPKTERSVRSIALPDFVIDALKQHRARQLEKRLAAGSRWEENGLVFPNGRGRFLESSHLYALFSHLLERAGLPQIRFHDLRHSAATLLFSMGVHPKVVQELLGHSSIKTTMDIYSHMLPSIQREAMDKMDNMFGQSL